MNYKLPCNPDPTCLVIQAPLIKRTEHMVEFEQSRNEKLLIVKSQKERSLKLHKLNLRKIQQDYKSFDEWHKVDQIFIARDELVRALQSKKMCIEKRRILKSPVPKSPTSGMRNK